MQSSINVGKEAYLQAYFIQVRMYWIANKDILRCFDDECKKTMLLLHLFM